MPTYNGLFDFDVHQNLLPRDGEVQYHGPLLDNAMATHYLERLLDSVPWKNDETVINGKRIVTARKVAWIGDINFAYTYSGTTKTASAWTPELRELKSRVEEKMQVSFNSCLLNLYHHGDEGMAWHSDDETMLGRNTTIASLSLGAQRKFAFRHKSTRETLTLALEHGSLLVMQGETQHYWDHCLPKMSRINEARINLTFRTIRPTRSQTQPQT